MKEIKDLDKFREQFVRWTLRRASFRWPPRGEALKAARVDRGLYQCASCKNTFKNKEIKLDHIEPVIKPELSGMRGTTPSPSDSFDYGSFVRRLLCSAGGLQVLCGGCHATKTAHEAGERKEARRRNKGR